MRPLIALVTGASRGIGLATARLLTVRGITTIFTARNSDDIAPVVAMLRQQGHTCDALVLDVRSQPSIAEVASFIEEHYEHLDILINNAGVVVDDPHLSPSSQSLATWQLTFETNLFGNVAVTRALLPLIQAAPAGRIVNVSSSAGSLTLHCDPHSEIYPYKLPAYSASKAALNAWTIQLAYELRNSPIKVNAIQPGNTRTTLNPHGKITCDEAAEVCARFALLGADGPSGGFFEGQQRLPW